MKHLFKKLPVLAFILAITAAFAFNERSSVVDDTYWFEYDGTVIDDYMGTSPVAPCQLPVGDHCALGFDEEDVIINGNDVQLRSGVDEDDADSFAYKED